MEGWGEKGIINLITKNVEVQLVSPSSPLMSPKSDSEPTSLPASPEVSSVNSSVEQLSPSDSVAPVEEEEEEHYLEQPPNEEAYFDGSGYFRMDEKEEVEEEVEASPEGEEEVDETEYPSDSFVPLRCDLGSPTWLSLFVTNHRLKVCL